MDKVLSLVCQRDARKVDTGQVHSAYCRAGHKSGDELVGQGRMTLIRKLADPEDGRLLSQKTHLPSV